jgi:hypothetical protein
MRAFLMTVGDALPAVGKTVHFRRFESLSTKNALPHLKIGRLHGKARVRARIENHLGG